MARLLGNSYTHRSSATPAFPFGGASATCQRRLLPERRASRMVVASVSRAGGSASILIATIPPPIPNYLERDHARLAPYASAVILRVGHGGWHVLHRDFQMDLLHWAQPPLLGRACRFDLH
ncbi:hypothetical protein OH77DRAFT_149674 [Trametes cingulata]|nr:hypothetical protein OH77DRAFT_149674 [Trametes cingulata]